MSALQTCKRCGHQKPHTPENFHRSTKGEGRLAVICKACDRRGRAPRLIEVKAGAEGAKACSKCKRWFAATRDNFSPSKANKSGLASWCKECYRAKRREYVASGHDKDVQRIRMRTLGGRWSSIRYAAVKRGYSWELTREQFATFWQKPCEWCGAPIENVGLDRIDSSKGYTMDNVVSSCGRCNMMKSDMTSREWIERMAQIVERHGWRVNQD